MIQNFPDPDPATIVYENLSIYVSTNAGIHCAGDLHLWTCNTSQIFVAYCYDSTEFHFVSP